MSHGRLSGSFPELARFRGIEREGRGDGLGACHLGSSSIRNGARIRMRRAARGGSRRRFSRLASRGKRRRSSAISSFGIGSMCSGPAPCLARWHRRYLRMMLEQTSSEWLGMRKADSRRRSRRRLAWPYPVMLLRGYSRGGAGRMRRPPSSHICATPRTKTGAICRMPRPRMPASIGLRCFAGLLTLR